MLSGGPDSVGMLWGVVGLLGPGAVTALHVNYGLREGSGLDESLCRELCDGIGVELSVIRAGEREGNLHDWARTVRYGEAERLAEERGLDWIAVGHTRTDLVETVLYRLASSPGTRALRAMPARRGRLVRPLLGLGRDEVRREVEAVLASHPAIRGHLRRSSSSNYRTSGRTSSATVRRTPHCNGCAGRPQKTR